MRELQNLMLQPSSSRINWGLVCDIAGISTTQRCWTPPLPPFERLAKVVTQASEAYLKISNEYSVYFSEIGLYPAVEVLLLDALLTYQENGGKGKYRVVQQFPVLKRNRQGMDFSVDFSFGIVQVCSGFCEMMIC